jgi:hypothetical protein
MFTLADFGIYVAVIARARRPEASDRHAARQVNGAWRSAGRIGEVAHAIALPSPVAVTFYRICKAMIHLIYFISVGIDGRAASA